MSETRSDVKFEAMTGDKSRAKRKKKSEVRSEVKTEVTSKTKERAKNDGEAPSFKVTDRRHWALSEEEKAKEGEEAEASQYPTMIDEYRQRAEAAERKLHEYIAAFKQVKEEQEQFRERLGLDVERRVDLQFGELVSELLHTVDDLELALGHVEDVPEATRLAEGVAMARDRFLSVLEKHGVETIRPDDTDFDPNLAEAMQMDPIDSPEKDGKVTRTLRPGYKLGDRVIRPARVAVGKHQN